LVVAAIVEAFALRDAEAVSQPVVLGCSAGFPVFQ
jgi:hypothetical protein